MAGLIVEIILATIIAYRGTSTFLENWAPVIADVLIALGVYGEIHFAGRVSDAEQELRRRSEERVSEANKRAREAEARAAEAMLELEKLKVPRVITPRQALTLRSKLQAFSKRTATVTASPRAFESSSLADQIANILGLSGVEARRQHKWGTFDPGLAEGIAACFRDGNEAGASFATAFAHGLKAEGFEAETYPMGAMTWPQSALGDWLFIVAARRRKPRRSAGMSAGIKNGISASFLSTNRTTARWRDHLPPSSTGLTSISGSRPGRQEHSILQSSKNWPVMKTINLEDLERQRVARKRELGIAGADFLPLNDGTRRTESKRRLLRTIAENAAAQGREPPFTAKET